MLMWKEPTSLEVPIDKNKVKLGGNFAGGAYR